MADDIDPSDWLAGQFGEDEPEQPTRRRRARSADEPPPAAAPAAPTPPAATEPPAAGGGFSWGLTPSAPAAEPAAEAPPVLPSWGRGRRAVEPAAAEPEPLVEPLVEPPAAPPPLVQPPAAAPPSGAWDVPTVATPVQREPEPGTELTRQEFPGFGAPVDDSIEGVTEVLGAHPVGLGAPDDEGPEVSALDSLFGDTKFVEYEDALIPALPARASGTELVVTERPRAVAAERVSITRNQKILMAVAGGIVAVLLLVVLFLAGSRLAQNSPPPVADPSPSTSALPTVGPLPAGEYRWDQLLGGECITPFTSPWADTFTVVPCTQEHQAQLVLTGTLPADPAVDDSVYPGADALQARVAALCAAPSVIDYAAVGGLADVQLLGSFAADEQQWLDGDRSFSCFASRAGGATFTTSIQPAA